MNLRTIMILSIISQGMLAGMHLCAADDLSKKAGSSAAKFLRFDAGARHAALGESSVSMADDGYAPLINPAGAGFLLSPELQAMHGTLLSGLFYDSVSYVHPTKIGSFGTAVQYLGGSKMTKIVNGVADGKFSAYDAAGNISYGLQIHEMFAAGINLKMIQSKIADESASTGAADIGIKFRTKNDLFTAGLVGQHIGGSMKFIKKSDPLPTIIRAGTGLTIDLPKHNSLIHINGQANIPMDNKPYYSFGIEHWGGGLFALRFGYTIDMAKNELDPIADWRAGIGFKIKHFLLDYAFEPFDVLGNTHLVSVGWRFMDFGSRKKHFTATLRVDPMLFSPNGDGIKDSTFLIPTVPPEMSEIKDWKIEIQDTTGSIVKTLAGKDTIASILSWDGKNEFGAYVENGEYSISMFIRGENRTEAKTPAETIYIDVASPEATLILSTAAFSPNGDGVDDTVQLHLMASDIHGIARWQLNITNQQGKFVHVEKSSAALPIDITWNGRDDYYNAVVPNGYYDLQFFVWDNAGNRNSSAINSVHLNTIKEFKNINVKEEKRGLVVNLTSNVLFGPGKAVLQPASASALDELIELLKSYPKNKVAIEGHSDSVGSEKMNMHLSSARAWAVYSYLVRNGIDPKRLKPKGYGESRPIASNKTKAGRDKNRRVNIIILKTPKKKPSTELTTE